MKWNIILGSMVLGLMVSAQSFGFELLDRMLGVGCGCEAKAGCDAKGSDGCCARPSRLHGCTKGSDCSAKGGASCGCGLLSRCKSGCDKGCTGKGATCGAAKATCGDAKAND
jgi:hypothetical protein